MAGNGGAVDEGNKDLLDRQLWFCDRLPAKAKARSRDLSSDGGPEVVVILILAHGDLLGQSGWLTS